MIMNIDDLENSLNNFDPELAVVVKNILNVSTVNMAYLEAVLKIQMEILTYVSNKENDLTKLTKSVFSEIDKRIAELQANFSSNL